MLLLFILLAGGAVAVAALGRPTAIAGKKIPEPLTSKDVPPFGRTRETYEVEPPTQGLRVWGESEQDTGATYRPVYIRWDGCHDFMWGFCAKDFLDNLGQQNTPRFQQGKEYLFTVIKWVFPAAAVGEWLTKNFCLRFKFPLYIWKDEYGGGGWEVGRWDAGQLSVGTPPSPLVQREGWHRAWIRVGEFDSSTRNATTVQLFFSNNPNYPENSSPITIELLGTKEMRAMLRLDANVTGAMDVKRLAGVICKDSKAKFWQSTRAKAMAEFS